MKLMRDSWTRERHAIVRRIRSEYGLPARGPAAIYVLHFVKGDEDFSLGHARHYLGFVGRDLDHRVVQHRKGDGAKLVRAVMEHGGDFVVALTFRLPLDRARRVERQLKDNGSGVRICPLCAAENRDRRAAVKRVERMRKRLQAVTMH